MQELNSEPEFFIQEVTREAPSMSSELRSNYENVAVAHLEYEPDFPNYVVFAIANEQVVSYLSFALAPTILEIVGAYTDAKWRGKGLFTKAFQALFSSAHAQDVKKFSIIFDTIITPERSGAHDAIIRWFKAFGPQGTTLKVYFGGKPITYESPK